MKVTDCQGRLKLSTNTHSRFLSKNPDGGSWRVKSGNFQLWGVGTSGWYAPYVDSSTGAPSLAMGPFDASVADTYTSECT